KCQRRRGPEQRLLRRREVDDDAEQEGDGNPGDQPSGRNIFSEPVGNQCNERRPKLRRPDQSGKSRTPPDRGTARRPRGGLSASPCPRRHDPPPTATEQIRAHTVPANVLPDRKCARAPREQSTKLHLFPPAWYTNAPRLTALCGFPFDGG